MTRRRRKARQPEVVVNALFVAEQRHRGGTGDRYSIWVVLTIVLIGFAIILAVAR